MPIALARDTRKALERVVKEARIVAEDGAETLLGQLGVADAERPDYLSEADRDRRRKLREHARTLGDRLNTGKAADLKRLRREIAYAHWHRALFARFLLENDLLVDAESDNVPLTANDVAEIARAENKEVPEVAAEFAEPMLPQIFPKDDPVLALKLPPETVQALTALVASLPAQTFAADDSLGWTYQFWQADRSDQIRSSGDKIGADELPAVTQFFTEDYMVLFLLENTLGAWWAGKVLASDPDLAAHAADEDELRRMTSPAGFAWTYLRFVKEDTEAGPHWRPASGTFPGWPKAAKDITMLDPCMGSGHFLVFALDIIVALRRAEEGLSEEEAVTGVLAENLHGLEIDPRCTQIAAFALALAAWKRFGGVRPLPALNLACSGLSIGMGKAEFVKLAVRMSEAEGVDLDDHDLARSSKPAAISARARRGALGRLYDLFAQAPILGSLIDPKRALGSADDMFETSFDNLAGILGKVLDKARGDAATREAAVTAQGLAKAAELLGQQFTLIATNVPFLGKNKQVSSLQDFGSNLSKAASVDLTTLMLRRIEFLSKRQGATVVVTPVAWWLQTSYTKMRREHLNSNFVRLAANLGPAAFSDMNWWAQVTVLTVTEKSPYLDRASLLDASRGKWPATKSRNTIDGIIKKSTNAEILSNVDSRIAVSSGVECKLLNNRASSLQGISPADAPSFSREFWEIDSVNGSWSFWQSTPEDTEYYTGRSLILESGRRLQEAVEAGKAFIRGEETWGKKGIVVKQIGRLPVTLATGEMFDTNCAVILPDDPKDLIALWCFVSDESYLEKIRAIDQKLNVTNATLTKVPFDLTHWHKVAAEKYPNGLPKPHTNDPTQWLFDGHPRGSLNPNTLDADGKPMRPGLAEHPLQVAVARLLGYRWPRQTGSSFMDCPAIDEPDAIDQAGVADEDGIVCLPAIYGERPAHEQVRGVLQAAWGDDWAEGVERACLEAEGTDKSLEAFLADGFFEGHLKLFHQTPFVWHVWDGLKGGFSALLNYHRLCAPGGEGRRLLEKLRDSYLGEWIAAQRRALDEDAAAEERLAAAEHLKEELTRIVRGDPPYDIFVRWKPLAEQPIGWEPDIGDGVRLNIRPFLTARPRNARAKNACILRVTPSLKHRKDRGKEPMRDKADFPWFWAEDGDVETKDFVGGAEFRGNRYNDFHYTRAFKQAARDGGDED